MAPRLTTLIFLAALLTVSSVNAAADLAETLLHDSTAIVTVTSAAAAFVNSIDKTTVADKAPLVFGLLADIYGKYHEATVNLEAIPTPILNPLTEEQQAEIGENLKAIVLAQKDLSSQLAAKTELFAADGYDQPIVWVLEDTLLAVGKYAEQLKPKFLDQPSQVMKKQLDDLIGMAIKAYNPAAPAPKAAVEI